MNPISSILGLYPCAPQMTHVLINLFADGFHFSMYNDFPLFVYLLCDIEPLDLFNSCITKKLYHTFLNKSRRSLVYHPQLVAVSFLVKYSACAECEIIHLVNCEISHFVRCEMKFAFSHLRSKYFTAELFHMAEPYFTRRRRISSKKAHIVLVDKCVLFSGGGWWIRTTEVSDNRFTVCPLWPLGKSPIWSW